tara:strand:+ start:1013 stop:1279 length:267 start_codon:yes stop_codon:yes gene_type:complete
MHLHYAVKFQHLGYFVDYMINNKYVGSINMDTPDRKIIGYNGKQDITLENDITLSNNKVIKKGMLCRTYLYPLCGRSNFDVTQLAKNK